MAHIGNGNVNNSFLQWDEAKRQWVSTVESAYVHLDFLNSSGLAIPIGAGSLDWTPLPTTNWTVAKGVGVWEVNGSGLVISSPGRYIGKWFELEVKASVFASGGGTVPTGNPTFAFGIAQVSDGVNGTNVYPKFEQRANFQSINSSQTELEHITFKNAIQYTHAGIRIYGRSIVSGGGFNINFMTAQITAKPL
jgi:hypothetical protein